ncbi:MAG: hypothetical protein RLZZ217_1705, partial [Planctomycetota bacterium]
GHRMRSCSRARPRRSIGSGVPARTTGWLPRRSRRQRDPRHRLGAIVASTPPWRSARIALDRPPRARRRRGARRSETRPSPPAFRRLRIPDRLGQRDRRGSSRPLRGCRSHGKRHACAWANLRCAILDRRASPWALRARMPRPGRCMARPGRASPPRSTTRVHRRTDSDRDPHDGGDRVDRRSFERERECPGAGHRPRPRSIACVRGATSSKSCMASMEARPEHGWHGLDSIPPCRPGSDWCSGSSSRMASR